MRVPISPFVTPDPSIVSEASWFIEVDGEVRLLPASVPLWDYQSELQLQYFLQFDLNAFLAQCNLSASSQLALILTVRSDQTKIERKLAEIVLSPSDRGESRTKVRVSGSDLGGRLTLESQIVVKDAVPLNPLAASRPGSILWRSLAHTVVEGESGQFPTDASDFGISDPKFKDAGWILKVYPHDIESSFMSSVRLHLNTGQEPIRKLLAGSRDPATAQLSRFLDNDITRQLVYHALRSEEICNLDPDPEGTTYGLVLRNLLEVLWPGSRTSTLRLWFNDSPERIEVQIQAARRVFK